MFYSFRNRKPRVGNQTYVSEHALLIGDVKIGDNCYIGHGAVLRGDYGSIEVGSGTAVEEGVVVHAPPEDVCRIGNRVTIGHGAVVHGSLIGDSVLIGMGAVVSLYAEVGEATIVAEGSVVTTGQKVPQGVVVGGIPATVLRQITEEDRRLRRAGNRDYAELAREYLHNGMQRLDAATPPTS